MTRAALIGSASLLFVCCASLPACSQQDETQAVLAQCSDPPPGALDSCLERARVLDETNPNPDIQALVAKLIERQARNSEPVAPPDTWSTPPPDDNGVSSYDTTPPTPPPSPDLGPLQPYQPPPDANPQEETPPDIQGNPADAGAQDAPPDNPTPPYTPPQNSGPGPGN